jgi:hypothetical protein
MTKADALREYYRAKLDAMRDPYLLTDNRLADAYHAATTPDFNAWCERIGLTKKETPVAQEGTPNDDALVALATIAADSPHIVKIERTKPEAQQTGNTVNAADHFAALKNQVEAKQVKQG